MKSRWKPFLFSLTVLLFSQLAAWAQFDTASVLGTVQDRSGGAVANAKIVLRNVATGVEQTSQTDANGAYQFVTVKIGRYVVSAEAPGFKKAVAAEFGVTVAARQRVDLVLEVGDVAETVTVAEAANPLESDSSSRGTVVGAQQILNLPLNGRAYADLALLAPGVRRSLLVFAGRDASFNVNGMRSSQNNFIIDGVDNNAYGTSNQGFSNQVVQITPDAVQEFRIETNNFSAEYGRAGGAVINAAVRTGTNEFHGAAWWFGRNTALNAFGFFKNDLNRDGRVDSADKPTLEQNQFGGALGGPVSKNRLFFFGNYEGYLRDSSVPTFSTTVPDAVRGGDFTSLPTAIRNPLTGEPLPGNIIPASQIRPFARDLLAALPASNVAGTLNYFTLPPRSDRNDKGDGRLDSYLNSRLNIFGRYSHRLMNNFEPPAIPGPAGGNSNGRVRVLNQQLALGGNYTLSPTSLFEARLGISHTEGGKVTVFQGQENVYTRYNIPNGPTDERVVGGFYQQSINGYAALGVQSSNPQFQDPTVWNPKVNYSKILGRHTLKSGYEFQAIHTKIDDFNPKYGSDSYAGQFSRPAGAAANNLYNVVDFFYGARSQYQLNNIVIVNYRQHMHFWYLQDDWKVNNRLTLNLGVRYEYGTPQWERDGLLSNYDPAGNRLIGAKKEGSIAERALVNPDRNNWAPRLGGAFRLNSRTVLRSAYGLSYIHFNRMGGENILSYNLPTIIGVSIPQNAPPAGGPPLCTSLAQRPQDCFRTREQGYPNNLLSLENVSQINVRANYIPRDLRSGYIQSYHVTLQRQLALGFVLDVGYVGNRASRIMVLGDFNQARPNGPTENLNVNQRRPIPGFGQIQIAFDGGFLNYDGLQAKIEKRQGSLFLLNSFTYSRSIDNASGHLETASGDNSRLNFRDIPSERGYTGYDQRWNNTTTTVWELPFGKGRRYLSNAHPIVQSVLGGWRFNGIHTVNAGLPYNIIYSPQAAFQVAGGGAPNYRPNLVGPAVLPASIRTGGNRLQFLNPCLSNADPRFAFCQQVGAGVLEPADRTQPFGNAFRNGVRGPMFYQFDTGLHKDFPVGERLTAQFRFEAFNLFNRTNFSTVDVNRTSAGFGRINSAFPARELQFALKFLF